MSDEPDLTPNHPHSKPASSKQNPERKRRAWPGPLAGDRGSDGPLAGARGSDGTLAGARGSDLRGRIRRGVIGILCRGDRYLLIRRAPGVAAGGAWCFPGGHVERGENARRAIVREMHEELGIEVTPVHRLGAVKGRPDVMLAIWIVEHTGGRLQPNPSEVSETRWYSGDQIRRLPDGLPSNHRVVDLLEAWRRDHGE